MADEDKEEDTPGLIDLDMGSFGSGKMNDPLRHAMGLRSAQDQCKMRMWTSWPTLFQNTIFHGEQNADIKELRHGRPMADRLARARELKEEGNAQLKSAGPASATAKHPALKTASTQQNLRVKELSEKVQHVEATILAKEQELKRLRQELRGLKAELESESSNAVAIPESPPASPRPEEKKLEAAITSYEKAAGILRYVECFRPDWKNDDGSYKGIEDEWLRVDESALQGDAPESTEARDLVTSCYLNIALAYQKLEKHEDVRNACTELLDKVNPRSAKALFRRAQARIAPVSAMDADRDAAIQDLHAAAQLAPQDKEIRGLLTSLRAAKKAQEAEDRNRFAGMFDRGEVVTNDPRTEGAALESEISPKMDLRDPRVQAMLDIRPGPMDT